MSLITRYLQWVSFVKNKKKCTLFECQRIEHEGNWGYYSEKEPPFYMVIPATRKASRFRARAVHLFLIYLRNWVFFLPRESNPRPPALQSSSLPTELQSCDSCRGKEIVISVILSLKFTFSEIKIFHNLDKWCSSDFLLSASSPSVLSHQLLNFLWAYPVSLKGYPFLVYHWLTGTQKQRCPLLYFFLCWDRLVFTKIE